MIEVRQLCAAADENSMRAATWNVIIGSSILKNSCRLSAFLNASHIIVATFCKVATNTIHAMIL